MANNNQQIDPNIITEIDRIATDYKAQVVAGEIISNGIDDELLLFKNLSLFKRFVSKEIESVNIDRDNHEDLRLVFNINKEGIYDMLPETLFHANRKNNDTNNDETIFQALRREEKKARTFFSPIENEFARRLVYFDVFEREFINNSNEQKNRQFFEYFYGNSHMLTDAQLLTLLYILPLSHKIQGNVYLLSLTLSKIFNYKIIVTKTIQKVHPKIDVAPDYLLGNCTLGINSITTCSTTSYLPIYSINIHELNTADFHLFNHGGIHKNVLDFIQSYFFSANAIVTTYLHPSEKNRHCQTSSEGEFCFLNFNSFI